MKKDIHPTYEEQVEVTCSCGEKHVLATTNPNIRVEICSKCHPFYTGQEKSLDTAGRVDRFNKRFAKK